MATQLISPFSFLVWKEDKQELVAGTSDTTLGYMVLLTVDGVDVEDIVKYMKDQEDERWHDTVARNWPTYVKAVASAAGKPTFLDTGKCDVEYADINTGEVLEITLPATAASYQEAVRVETARSQHEMSARTKKGLNNALRHSTNRAARNRRPALPVIPRNWMQNRTQAVIGTMTTKRTRMKKRKMKTTVWKR